MGLFSKSVSKKDQVDEWCKKIRKEGYQLERQIRVIEREEMKVKQTLKAAAKSGDKDTCRILAKEIVNSRKTVARIHNTKAQMNSVQYQMKSQLATLRVSGALEKSAVVMKSMQQLVKLPEIAKTMQDMSKEMMKAGIMEEMLEDTMEMMEPEEAEEEVESEIDKIIFELTAGELGKAPALVSDTLVDDTEGAVANENEPEEEVAEMRQRLEALRS